MKNVNLTGLYLALIAKCPNVTGFTLSSLRKVDSIEPTDAVIDFDCLDASLLNEADIKVILDANITGEVKEAEVRLKSDSIHIYIEFLGSDASHWDKLS